MACKANVVIGEAPESDSEDELNVADGVPVASCGIGASGLVMAGEAPESDDELTGKSSSQDSISSAFSASSVTVKRDSKQKSPVKEVSLLSKKLSERNVSLAKNISDLVSHTVSAANNELNQVDQRLLKCQVQVQEAEDLLKSINANVLSLEKKLRLLLFSEHIPDICLPENA